MVHSSYIYIYIYIKGNVKVSNQTWAFKKTKEKKKKKKVGTKKVSNGEFCGFTLVIEQIKVLLLKTYWLFIYIYIYIENLSKIQIPVNLSQDGTRQFSVPILLYDIFH